MNDIVSLISLILNGIIGSGVFVSWMFFRKQTKRIKDAEAFEKEVSALRSAIEVLKNQIAFYDKRLEELQKLVTEKDSYIGILSTDKNTLEVKHAKNKTAINAAYGCTFCEDKANCPVLVQRARNEEEYLKRIEK